MYALNKKALSHYVSGECKRRLRLDLYATAADRETAGAPEKDPGRPGLALLARQGRTFERRVFRDLAGVFKGRVVHGAEIPTAERQERAFKEIHLADHIDTCADHRFLIEAQYPICDTFFRSHALNDLRVNTSRPRRGGGLSAGHVRPDIVHVVPPGPEPREAITKNGEIVSIATDDIRLGLRIIDVKLSGEPSPAHFAELAFYGMVLAAWLEETGRSERFLVLKDAAIWPGKHQASAIALLEAEARDLGGPAPSLATLLEALQRDLEALPAEVVLGRVQRFLSHDLREVLDEPDWSKLPWHVDSGCSGCDFLGYDWKSNAEDGETIAVPANRQRHCWNDAAVRGHLSRIVGLTRGACGKLKGRSIETIADLAALDVNDAAFDEHQRLMATRTLVRARSETLAKGAKAAIPDRAGTSSVLPAWSDVKVALTVDFDIGSGLTFALGCQISVATPRERQGQREDGKGWFKYDMKRLPARPMLVRKQSPEAEQAIVRQFMALLVRDLQKAADEIEAAYERLGLGKKEKGRKASFQVYLWDRLTFDHLCRVTGRHLPALLAPDASDGGPNVAPMAWLFPAEQVIQDADFTSVNSPITILSDAIQSMLAADVPHHYGLMAVANAYHQASLDRFRAEKGFAGPAFRLHSFFLDPLSDQIPSERGHEIWTETSPFADGDAQAYEESLRRVVRIRLNAVFAVADRLTEDLSGKLSAAAPSICSILDQTKPLGAVAQDFEILYQHARLMAGAARMKVDLLMALPPHQREATFESARFHELLNGPDRTDALTALDLGCEDGSASILVFRMSRRSNQAKIEKGDFLRSLMPENALDLQHRSLAWIKERHPRFADLSPPVATDFQTSLREACQVRVEIFDRATGIAVLRTSGKLRLLLQAGVFEFKLGRRADGGWDYAILDPLVVDFFVGPRLRRVLRAIKAPKISADRPLFRNAVLTRLRMSKPRLLKQDPPIARFFWDADALAREASGRDFARGLTEIARAGKILTPRQHAAVMEAVGKRLCLLWGPPGTGKTFTVVAIIRALLTDAIDRGTGLRLAITGPTWVAIETIARKLPEILERIALLDPVLARLASGRSDTGSVPAELRDHVVATDNDEAMSTLRARLQDPGAITIVASTAHQINALVAHERLEDGSRTHMAGLFDFMLVDEASQMPVSQAVVAFAALDKGASVTVVGDDLQMPPIQPVEAPEGASHLVGSIYDFYRHYRRGERRPEPEEPPAIDRIMLDRSYRSNAEIVAFVREAGYGPSLKADKPGLRMRLADPLPLVRPPFWPATLPWHDHLARILDPGEPLVAVINPDPYSSQRNEDEADLVAGLVRTLMGRLGDPEKAGAYTTTELFEHGLGIVTPHRAQQAAIVERLSDFLLDRTERAAMMTAVDTVERFQGQERDVMIASFGLGDRDQIGAEEEFLYSLNRFNVIASRAKAKLIVIMSRRLVDHLPRDPQVLRASRLLKHFADGYLPRVVPASIPGLGACEIKLR